MAHAHCTGPLELGPKIVKLKFFFSGPKYLVHETLMSSKGVMGRRRGGGGGKCHDSM